MVTWSCFEASGNPRVDSRFAPCQWETALLCNDVSHWLGTNLESALQPSAAWPQAVCLYNEEAFVWVIIIVIIVNSRWLKFNTLWPEQYGCHLTDDNFKYISLREKSCISIEISLKLNVSKGPIDDMIALVHVMTWHQTGDKPLPEPIWTLIYNDMSYARKS